MAEEAVVLVGHGGLAKGTPPELVAELKRVESARRQSGGGMGERQAVLDAQVRGWPRTPETDPYKFGLEAVAERLGTRLPDVPVVTAFNEFCAPSVADAIDGCVAEGATRITLITTMFTPGGHHSEIEIPEDVAAARKRHPAIDISYSWPFDLDRAAAFLAESLGRGE